jgi:4-hydroxy-4-methyl-2-oxoglutarate aldolase
MTDAAVARAAKIDTATLSDALDKLGLNGQCHGITPRDPGFRMAGRAFTILYGPAGDPRGTVGDFIDDVPEGGVIVLDNGGRTDATVWGDIMTEIAHRRKLGGTLIDGVNRDVYLCRELGYPVFSRNAYMRTGKDRVQVEGTNVAVTIGGVRVGPGDIVVGDPDGVVVIQSGHEDAVLDAAEYILEAEIGIRAAIRDGMRLDEARERFGYHTLQTKV